MQEQMFYNNLIIVVKGGGYKMNMEERKNEIYSLIKEVNDEDVVEYIFKIVKDITKTGTT